MSKVSLENLLFPIIKAGVAAQGEAMRTLLAGFINPYRQELTLTVKRARPDVARLDLSCEEEGWRVDVYADPGRGIMAKLVFTAKVRYLDEVRTRLERWLLDTARAGRG